MIGLDTNAFVRYITQDEPGAGSARERFDREQAFDLHGPRCGNAITRVAAMSTDESVIAAGN